jgi:hypothetical protein
VRRISHFSELPKRLSDLTGGKTDVWVSVGLRGGQTAGALPEELVNEKIIQQVVDFSGLRLMSVELDPTRTRGSDCHFPTVEECAR